MSYRIEYVDEAVSVPVTYYTDVKCDACESALEPVESDTVDEQGRWVNLMTNKTLPIKIRPVSQERQFPWQYTANETKILCSLCAAKLFEAFPSMSKAVSASWGFIEVEEAPAAALVEED